MDNISLKMSRSIFLGPFMINAKAVSQYDTHIDGHCQTQRTTEYGHNLTIKIRINSIWDRHSLT